MDYGGRCNSDRGLYVCWWRGLLRFKPLPASPCQGRIYHHIALEGIACLMVNAVLAPRRVAGQLSLLNPRICGAVPSKVLVA